MSKLLQTRSGPIAEHGHGCCGTAVGPAILKLAVSEVRESRFGVVCLELEMKQVLKIKRSVANKHLWSCEVNDDCRSYHTCIKEVLLATGPREIYNENEDVEQDQEDTVTVPPTAPRA